MNGFLRSLRLSNALHRYCFLQPVCEVLQTSIKGNRFMATGNEIAETAIFRMFTFQLYVRLAKIKWKS